MVSVDFIWNPLHICCPILNVTRDKAVQTSCCCFFSCYQMIKHSESTVTTYVYTYDKDVEVCVSKGRTQNSPTQRKFSTTFSPFFTDRCFLPVVLKNTSYQGWYDWECFYAMYLLERLWVLLLGQGTWLPQNGSWNNSMTTDILVWLQMFYFLFCCFSFPFLFLCGIWTSWLWFLC